MLEHNVPKEELETRAFPFNKVTIALLLPDQDVWRGGGVSCQELRVAGSHRLYSLVYRCTLSSSDLERSVPGVVKGSTRGHGTC